MRLAAKTAVVAVSCGERRAWCGIGAFQAVLQSMVVVSDGELKQSPCCIPTVSARLPVVAQQSLPFPLPPTCLLSCWLRCWIGIAVMFSGGVFADVRGLYRGCKEMGR